ncbi:MAG: abortive infection system antitoxin AbiGi family protein, partial [Alphaproteobacteria bacterium]
QILRAFNPFGIGRKKAPDLSSQKVCCFSEVPLHFLKRIAANRSPFGVGFRKQFLIDAGGNPILYAYKSSALEGAIQSLMSDATTAKNPNHPIWTVAPFVDVPGEYNGKPFHFEWEREWRHVGDMKFSLQDVACLIIPEHSHAAAHQFFIDAIKENTGPGYFCPYVDATWDFDKVGKALEGSNASVTV